MIPRAASELVVVERRHGLKGLPNQMPQGDASEAFPMNVAQCPRRGRVRTIQRPYRELPSRALDPPIDCRRYCDSPRRWGNEEAIGILDFAERRRESVRNFDRESVTSNSSRIRYIRHYLVLLMAEVLAEKLEHAGALHARLIDALVTKGLLTDTIFLIH